MVRLLASNKKILLHSNYMPSNSGGIESVVFQLINILSSLNLDPTVVCSDRIASGVVIHRDHKVIRRRILFKFLGAPFLSLGNRTLIRESRSCNLLIYQEPFPSLWPAIFLIRWAYKVPVILLIHANPVAPALVRNIYSFLRGIVFRGAICVATSENLLRKVRFAMFSRSFVIPLGIPDVPLMSKNIFDLHDDFVLYIGRLASYKGLPYLLRAAQALPRIKFVIAGDGDMAEYTHSFIVDNKIKNILFINRFVTDDEKLDLIAKCKFVVFPSISENEAFGLVQLEAMRSGKALVNTMIDSGVNFVAPDGVCALTVKPCNSFELAMAIDRLWGDDSLCASLGASGRDRYLSLFTEENFRILWENLLFRMGYA